MTAEPTAVRAVEVYLDHLAVERGLAANTLSSYRRDLTRWTAWLAAAGHTRLSEVVEADVARGRRLTSWPSIRTDLRNAGAEVVDEQVVTDGNITTSRSPDDLPAFCERIVQDFAGAGQAAVGRA